MKTSFTSGFLFRSLLLTSFTSSVACSPVLQATRLNKILPQQPAEMVVDASLKP